MPVLIFILTLHSSMSHELIHGHPTRHQNINDLLAYPPLGMMFPYRVFKTTHLQHHHDEDLTFPGIDPESFFCTREAWAKKCLLRKTVARINMTMFGRLALGPALTTFSLLRQSAGAIFGGRSGKWMWLTHFLSISVILFVVTTHFKIPWWQYLLCAYISQSMIMLRSFFEHRPVSSIPQRIVLQETCWFFRFLYLNNNYHLVHHQYPGLPWYFIHNEYQRNKARYLEQNSHYHFNGYSDWLRYLFRPIADPRHPFYSSSPDQSPQ